MRRFRLCLALLPFSLPLGACGGDPKYTLPPTDLSSNKPDAGCAPQTTSISAGPPELYIVLDRSGSMSSSFGMGTRWTAAVTAIRELVGNLESQVNFGLTAFPGEGADGCDVYGSLVQPASGSAAEIDSALGSMEPWGLTPSGAAVNS